MSFVAAVYVTWLSAVIPLKQNTQTDSQVIYQDKICFSIHVGKSLLLSPV